MSVSLIALIVGFGLRFVAAQDLKQEAAAGRQSCNELNRVVQSHVAIGRFTEAEAALLPLLAQTPDRPEHTCAGLILSNIASVMVFSGRFNEAEAFAERSIRALKNSHSPDDPIFLRPLNTLATVGLEHGKLTQAREVYRQMALVRLSSAEDRAMVHGVAAALFQSEGRDKAAELEFLAALKEWQQCGRGQSADAAGIMTFLGSVYVEQGRFHEAGRMLDRALSVFANDKNTLSLDHIKLLQVRGALHARQSKWKESENEMRQVILLSDREPLLDAQTRARMLLNYAFVLRKSHRRREALSIEARASALSGQSAKSAIMGVTELAPSKASRN